jgi:outer membrane immunogenic protein
MDSATFSGAEMKRISVIIAIALLGTPAFAADMAVKMPVKAPPPAPPPAYNWTGFYVGGFVGAGWVHDDVDSAMSVVDPGFFNGALLSRTFTNSSGGTGPAGPLGGVTVGYNWQMAGTPVVLGIEGDFAWADLKDSSDFAVNRTDIVCCFDTEQITAATHTNFTVRDIALITARLGLLSAPHDWMWYLKGGAAWARTDV